MHRKLLITALVTVAALALMAPGIAFAGPAHPKAGPFLNAGDVPAGSVLVVNVTAKVTNDEDSGNVGYWALDDYNKHVQVWQVPDGSFYAVVRYEGKWTSFKGALSPGAGTMEGSDGNGTFEGGYVATFKATGFTAARGNAGSFDFGGTKTDVLLGTYGNGQVGGTPTFDWTTKYFTGVADFVQPEWGWTYKYKNQRWYNFSTGTTGDILF